MRNKHLKAASWYTISNFIAKALVYILTPLYARLLTTWEYGQYSNLLSWQHIISAIISLEFSSTIAIGYVDFKGNKDFQEYISTISICGILIPLLISTIMMIFRKKIALILNMDSYMLLIMMLGISFGGSLAIFQAENRQKLKYKLASLLTIISSCLCVPVILFLLTIINNKLYAVVIGSNLASTLINICALFLVLKRGVFFKIKYLKYALLISIPLIPHVLAANILGSSDKIMITKICGSEETAFYSIVYTCSMIINVLITSINNAWIPWFFKKLKENDYAKIQSVSKKLIYFIFLICILLCIMSPEIIQIIGGKKYLKACYIMPPIIVSCCIRYIYTLYVNIEFFNKKTFGISIGTIVSSVINIVLNYICIKMFGYIAAAYTTLFSSYVLLFIHLIIVKKQGFMLVHNNRFNLISSAAIFVVSMLTILTYDSYIIRYNFLIAASLLLIVYMYVSRNKIRSFFDTK